MDLLAKLRLSSVGIWRYRSRSNDASQIVDTSQFRNHIQQESVDNHQLTDSFLQNDGRTKGLAGADQMILRIKHQLNQVFH